jgi:hypothetical protein
MTAGGRRRASVALAGLLILAGVALVALGAWRLGGAVPTAAEASATASRPPPSPTETEPILPPPPTATRRQPPTAKPAASAMGVESPLPGSATAAVSPPPASPTPSATRPAATAAPSPSVPTPDLPRPSPTPTSRPQGMLSLQARIGVCGGGPAVDEALAKRLGFGWYLNWGAYPGAYRSAAVEYVPMIRLSEEGARPAGEALLGVVDALPGALWLIGNEPDVKWQDNVTPERYAELYHELYTALKGRDPTCRVAIGGVSQPTPLRLRYLDRILAAYEARYGGPMPVDVWNVHNFILREERDSWGVDIPPGLAAGSGVLREIADHDDLSIFGQQIVDFRRWMKVRGQQDKPLIVTEYGILMPADYGFPPEQVARFLVATFDYFRTATDPGIGYAADGQRLVQRWCWYSLADRRYPTGNLVDPDSGEITPLGEVLGAYLGAAR